MSRAGRPASSPVDPPAGSAPPYPCLDHLAIAVRSLDAALAMYHRAWGSTFVIGGDHRGLGIRTVQLALPTGSKIELLTPLDDSSPLHAHLERHGEGPHHVTMIVDSLPDAIEAHRETGGEVVGIHLESGNWQEAFVLPGSGPGILVQLAESPYRWDVPVAGLTLDDVLDGKVTWTDYRPALDDGTGSVSVLGTETWMLRASATVGGPGSWS